MLTVDRNVDQSLWAEIVPQTLHVKQYDTMSRKVTCTLYDKGQKVTVPDDCGVNVSGSRQDGTFFQLSSSTDPDVVGIEDGSPFFWVTAAMTSCAGTSKVDVTITGSDGEALGAFTIVMQVSRSSVQDAGISTGDYSRVLESFTDAVVSVSVDDDGYLVIVTADALGITVTSDGEGNIEITY